MLGVVSCNAYCELNLDSLLNNKILDQSKLKAIVDDTVNMTHRIEIHCGQNRNIFGKRKKCRLPAFSPFPSMFSKGFFLRVVKHRDCVVKGYPAIHHHGFTLQSLTHYQTTNFILVQSKQSADNNFKFDENSRKFSKWIENTVGKGEIAHYEQFLLFPQCFQRACYPGASKGVIVWEWVKSTCTYLQSGLAVDSTALSLISVL